jgi:hypothetical protein
VCACEPHLVLEWVPQELALGCEVGLHFGLVLQGNIVRFIQGLVRVESPWLCERAYWGRIVVIKK